MRSSIFVLAVVALSSCGALETQDPCQSLCGCWEYATLSASGNTRSSDGGVVSGINVSCKAQGGVMAVTNSLGEFSFQVRTEESPGCGFRDCNTLVFEDPSQRFRTKELQVKEVQSTGGNVVLEP